MADTRYRDADWLQQQYWKNDRTLADIGDECGVCAATVLNWMERHGIERRDDGPRRQEYASHVVKKQGYEYWHCGVENTGISVHRLLAVAEYGTEAVKDMHVHHKNGVKWDNRPGNIELLTPSEHSATHIDDNPFTDPPSPETIEKAVRKRESIDCETCADLRERYTDGASIHELVSTVDVGEKAVYNHLMAYCRHAEEPVTPHLLSRS
jgi:hypothetical protein